MDKKAKLAAYGKAYKLANKEKIRAQAVAYRIANKEKIRAYQIAYQKAHELELKAGKRAWALANSDAVVKRVAAWQKAHPEKVQEYSVVTTHRRRARKAGARVGRVDFKAVRERNGMKCGICLLPIEGKFHYDHITPLARGGAHATENLQLAHPRCNLVKSSSLPLAR